MAERGPRADAQSLVRQAAAGCDIAPRPGLTALLSSIAIFAIVPLLATAQEDSITATIGLPTTQADATVLERALDAANPDAADFATFPTAQGLAEGATPPEGYGHEFESVASEAVVKVTSESASVSMAGAERAAGSMTNLTPNTSRAAEVSQAGVLAAKDHQLTSNTQDPLSHSISASHSAVEQKAQVEAHFNLCPREDLQRAYAAVVNSNQSESATAANTTLAIDALTLEGEVLRICKERQKVISDLFAKSASVTDEATRLLTLKTTSLAQSWAESETAVAEASAKALQLELDIERAKVAQIAQDERPAPLSSSAEVMDPTQTSDAFSSYRIRAITGSGGTLSARLLTSEGSELQVQTGDHIPGGLRVANISSNSVMLRQGEITDALQWAEPEPPRALISEGFLFETISGGAVTPNKGSTQ
jgi:type IV pilus biogenesis protein PilP